MAQGKKHAQLREGIAERERCSIIVRQTLCFFRFDSGSRKTSLKQVHVLKEVGPGMTNSSPSLGCNYRYRLMAFGTTLAIPNGLSSSGTKSVMTGSTSVMQRWRCHHSFRTCRSLLPPNAMIAATTSWRSCCRCCGRCQTPARRRSPLSGSSSRWAREGSGSDGGAIMVEG